MAYNQLKIKPYKPLRDEVYLAVRRAIATGRFLPGSKVKESELADRLGISRTPVREALRRLEAERFLTKARGSGLMVIEMSQAEVEETFGLRGVLEGYAARLAALRARAGEIERLGMLVAKSAKVLAEKERDRLLAYNTRFHDTLIALSGSPQLQALVSGLHDRILRYRRITLEVGEARIQGFRDHQAIYEAIQARDGRRAEQLVREHVEWKKEAVLGYLRRAFPEDGGRSGDGVDQGGAGWRRSSS